MIESMSIVQILLFLVGILLLLFVVLLAAMYLLDWFAIWRMTHKLSLKKGAKLPLSLRYYNWMESHLSEEKAEELANRVKDHFKKDKEKES
ncbi:MAG: hypothetical protein PHG16_07065 [Lachnospiraceae bacterium]|nr:hypothetical protein [Lachnospiraceae bacterium]